MQHLYKGTIKFFDVERGFGFIKSEHGEIFVHITGLEGYNSEKGVFEGGALPKEDDNVLFNVADGKKGPNAVDVRIVAGAGNAVAAHAEQAHEEEDMA